MKESARHDLGIESKQICGISDCRSRAMINFDFLEEGLGIVSYILYVYSNCLLTSL